MRVMKPDVDGSSMELTLFLCGDVMTGRGVDQILPHPCPPRLYEPLVRSALDYIALAERAYGTIPRAVDHAYVWGVALEELERRRPHARIVNLETSVTTCEDAAPKGINYRMHPANVGVLTAARVDCATLANNHVLDWGRAGLYETLDALARVSIQTAGAGRTLDEAEAPAILEVAGGGRVLVVAVAGPDCGVPSDWAASKDEPGVFRLDDYSPKAVDRIAGLVTAEKRAGDVAVASIHWGANWGFDVPAEHRRFAHQLIERAGIDVVHGHSSHHAKGIEVHRGRPIFYGCGDFLNDYEGIHGPKDYRDDLTLMYFPSLDARTGNLMSLEMVPLRIRNFQLHHPSAAERSWLRDTMARECRRFAHNVAATDHALRLEWD